MNNNEKVVRPDFVELIEINEVNDVKTNINAARNDFLAKHNKVMKTNKIVTGALFIAAIGLVVLGMTFENLIGLWFGLIVSVLIVIWIFTRYQRKQIDEAVSEYLFSYSINNNSYLFKGEEFNNITVGYKERPDIELLKQLNISDLVCSVSSRNVVKGTMLDKPFSVCDASLKVGDKDKRTQQKAVFVGKVYSFDYSFDGEGRAFIYLKGCGDAAPTKLDDVNKVEISGLKGDYEVYTSYKNYKSIFNKDVVKALNRFSTDETLNDLVISIVEGRVLIGLSYSDEAMVIPMNKDYEIDCLSHMEKELDIVKELNKALINNTYFTK